MGLAPQVSHRYAGSFDSRATSAAHPFFVSEHMCSGCFMLPQLRSSMSISFLLMVYHKGYHTPVHIPGWEVGQRWGNVLSCHDLFPGAFFEAGGG